MRFLFMVPLLFSSFSGCLCNLHASMVFKDMNINRLPQECHERLSCLLKYGPSVDWEALALVGFPSIYSDPLKLAKIENSPHPASALLDDLCCRGVSVETLLEALKVIGNERAVSVILEGELFSYSCFFLFPLPFSKHLPENN